MSYEILNAGRILEAQDQILEARALLGAAQNIYGVLATTQILAEIFYWQGEFEQAGQLNQQILIDAVGDESMLDDQGIAALNLAHIAYERNELEQAEQYAGRALNLGQTTRERNASSTGSHSTCICSRGQRRTITRPRAPEIAGRQNSKSNLIAGPSEYESPVFHSS